jgi:hypothetical protein
MKQRTSFWDHPKISSKKERKDKNNNNNNNKKGKIDSTHLTS